MQNIDLFGGIEAGGTKFVCGIGTGNGDLISRVEIPTESPSKTMPKIVAFFERHSNIRGIGIGSFGPVDLRDQSSNFGQILNTPKEEWRGINIYETVRSATSIPAWVATDTDVAAIGERFHGKALNCDSFAYITIGTGIGGSVIDQDRLLHGINHPEIGHIPVPRSLKDALVHGACKFHEDCLEGLASGKSMEIRTGVKPAEITEANVWEAEAEYISFGLVNVIALTQPKMIILGGSVMQHHGLLDMVRAGVGTYINGYIDLPNLDTYMVHSSGIGIGVLGAIKMAAINYSNGQTETI